MDQSERKVKTCIRRKARENHRKPSHVTFDFFPHWLEKRACLDWLEHKHDVPKQKANTI